MADKPDTLRFLGESRETEGWVPTTFGDYAITYFVAASCLVDEVLEGRASAAVLIPPIGYAYRHALELALKDANAWTESAISGWIKGAGT